MKRIKTIHYSIDDVIEVFSELTKMQPKSIFDIPFFAFLLSLHRQYGIVVSCYCFFKRRTFSLSECTKSYRHEFEKNASWLKFGFHGYTGFEDYESQPLNESIQQYKEVILNLKEIVGEKALDTFPRIHRFKASQKFIRYLGSNSILSQTGLLAADDDRISYSLKPEDNKKLKQRHFLIKEHIIFLETTQRFDKLSPFWLKKLFTYRGGVFLLFTHEYLLLHQKPLKLKIKSHIIKNLMKLVCKLYTKKGYSFSFPMDIKEQLKAI